MRDSATKPQSLVAPKASAKNNEENKTELELDIGATVADQAQSHFIKKEIVSNPPEEIEIEMDVDEDYSEDYEEDELNH